MQTSQETPKKDGDPSITNTINIPVEYMIPEEVLKRAEANSKEYINMLEEKLGSKFSEEYVVTLQTAFSSGYKKSIN